MKYKAPVFIISGNTFTEIGIWYRKYMRAENALVTISIEKDVSVIHERGLSEVRFHYDFNE